MTTRPAEPLTDADEAALRRTIDQALSDDWADSYRYHPRTIAMLFDTLDRERAARADERARHNAELRAAVLALPGEVGHFDGGDDFDTGYLTRAAVLVLLADPPS